MQMRKVLVYMTVAAAVAFSSGCTTMRAAKEEQAQYQVDGAYVAAVHQQARRMNTTVFWVNPPKTRVTAELEVTPEQLSDD
jgi:predicted alpha/beta hydrolase family esterase